MRVPVHLLLSVLLLISFSTMVPAQNHLITKENVSIPCRITSVSPQLIRYINSYNDQLDSIETAKLVEMRYGDTLRVMIVPATEKGKIQRITQANFLAAMNRDDFITLLHSRATLSNLTFQINRRVMVLTSVSRATLAPWVTILKAKPKLSMELVIHTDSAGKSITNQALSERQAIVLRNFLTASGVSLTNFSIAGRGESTPISAGPEQNRRVEIRCVGIKGINVLYAEKYIPPPKPKLPQSKPALDPVVSHKTTILYPPKQPRIGFVLYGEGLYALESLSTSWVNPDRGIGILQGFGGGALITYYLSPRFGLTLQGGYSKWEVQRRYMTEEREIFYTNDQRLQRIGVQVGFRLYALPTVYLQPVGGGQLLKLVSQNSETHPDGAVKTETQKFLPTYGGALGFEIGKKNIVIDIAAQYLVSPNTNFSGATGPLHYTGLRAGIGFRPRPR